LTYHGSLGAFAPTFGFGDAWSLLFRAGSYVAERDEISEAIEGARICAPSWGSRSAAIRSVAGVLPGLKLFGK
jgi:hypothetical protein